MKKIFKKIISDLPTRILSRYVTGTTGFFFTPNVNERELVVSNITLIWAIFKTGNGESGNRGIGESGNRGIRESGNRGIRESGNPGIGESGNRGIRESGNPERIRRGY